MSIIEGNKSWLVWTVGRTRLNDDPNDKMMMSSSTWCERVVYPAGRDPRTYHYHSVGRVAGVNEAPATPSRRDHTNAVSREDGNCSHSTKCRPRWERCLADRRISLTDYFAERLLIPIEIEQFRPEREILQCVNIKECQALIPCTTTGRRRSRFRALLFFRSKGTVDFARRAAEDLQ